MAAKHKKSQYFYQKELFSGLTSFTELENRISNLPEIERGDAFEVFAEAYFQTQVLHQALEVWPQKEMPQWLRDELNIEEDFGVDGVFKIEHGSLRANSGFYTAYQVKFRTNRSALTWGSDKLANFLGQSDFCDKRILFTNSLDLSSVTKKRRNFISVKGNDLDKFDRLDFQKIESWLATGVVKQEEKKLPRPHQSKAVDDILKEFETKDRATAVMACATGKTLVALWVAEKRDAQTILVLLPSLALIKQTLKDWVKDNNWEKFNFLCVCSDDTVTKGLDEIILTKNDVDFPVTTQKEVVAQFLQNKNVSRKIVFSTYQSCRIVGEAMQENFSFDIAIFDEAHKTATRQGVNYAFALQDKNLSIKKRLFLTATPRHYSIKKKDKEGERRLVFSMDDKDTYGQVAHQLSFRAAVKKRLICDYRVVISVVTSNMFDRKLIRKGIVIVQGQQIKSERTANILALQNAVTRYGIKRIFSFHSSVDHAQSFTAKTREGVGAYLEGFASLHVSGAMPVGKREALLKEFEESERAIISNARCLTEGVNVPAVDMVAFISPKKSKIDIVQAAGRAMRKHGGKKIGYILIPLFVQIAENESLEQALKKTKFDTIWDVLQAMQEQDENLVEAIAQMKREDPEIVFGKNDNQLREHIEFLGPDLCIDELRRAITTRIIDRLGLNWDARLGELIRYQKEYGHCNVPRSHDPQLALWVVEQRSLYGREILLPERIKDLSRIGFDWTTQKEKNKQEWIKQFNLLKKFKKIKKRWPKDREEYPEGNSLGRWCDKQRQAFKGKGERKALEDWQIEWLNEIDFEWEPDRMAWLKQYFYLKSFQKTKRRLPRQKEEYPTGNKLGLWYQNQRQALRKQPGRKPLLSWQAAMLNELGITL